MKKYIFSFLLFLAVLILPSKVLAKETVRLYLFYLDTCPHCAQEKELLKDLEKKYNNLEIYLYECSEIISENSLLYDKVSTQLDIEKKGSYPLTVIGSKYFIGYNDNVGYQIEDTIRYYSNFHHKDIVGEILEIVPIFEGEENPEGELTGNIKVPLLGEVDPKKVSIPLLAIIIGFIDGFNPCAMWVLIFLISIMLTMKNRKKMWILGLTFLGTSAFVYFLFMVAWLNIAIKMKEVAILRMIIALIALIAGTINLNNFFKTEESGCTVTDNKKRRKIMEKIRKFTSEKSLILAIIGMMGLAFTVNLIELACSAGLPLLFTQVLALNQLSTFSYYLYIFIYIFFFLIDDLIVYITAMITFKVTGISTKYTKYSHLIGGIIMIIIAALMILKPEWIMFNF